MERGVTSVASSTILKMYAEVPEAAQIHTTEKEAVHEQEPGFETVNISSVNFNSNHSTIIAKLKTSSNKAAIMVPYKVDMGSDGYVMPFNIVPKLFHSTTMDQLTAKRRNQAEDI